jgi:hypothetical protein
MRRLAPVLAIALLMAGCASSPPRVYTPLRYDYLTPLRLNVASVTIENRFLPAGSTDLNGQDPSPLVPTLTAMAQDRLQAVGSAGRAVFVIKDASLVRTRDGIAGSMDVELDVYAGGGTRAGFAEARVSRRRTGDIDDMQATLYDMTKQLMDAMNIEFEYQVRHSLKDWIAPSATPGAVQQQALPPPGSAAAPPPMPAAPSPLAPPSPYLPSTTLAPPTSYAPPSSLPPPRPYPTPYSPPSAGAASGAYPALTPGQSLGTLPTQLVPPRQP